MANIKPFAFTFEKEPKPIFYKSEIYEFIKSQFPDYDYQKKEDVFEKQWNSVNGESIIILDDDTVLSSNQNDDKNDLNSSQINEHIKEFNSIINQINDLEKKYK